MCTTVSLIGNSIDHHHHLHNMWLVVLLFSPKKSIKEIRLLQYYSSAAEEWNGHFVKLDRSVFIIIISISLAHTQPSNGSSWLIRFLYLLSKKVKFLLFLMLIAKAPMGCLLLRKASLVNIQYDHNLLVKLSVVGLTKKWS